MYEDFVRLVRELYGDRELIPLHEPSFTGNEKQYLIDTIDSTYVSSVGVYVNRFEDAVRNFTGVAHAIATVNGTAALHAALLLAGVRPGEEVITQAFTFVATCNAVRYCGAEPVFVDVSRRNLGMSAGDLTAFLDQHCELRDDGFCWNRRSNRIVRACLPMHSFGFTADLDALMQVCKSRNIVLVEDAAESLGSYYGERHTGTLGAVSCLSFNGNKIVTTGGGGMILTNDGALAAQARHLTTTAKLEHRWAFDHDEVGFNYRLPNLNAALGLAQMESLPKLLQGKRAVAERYLDWGRQNGLEFVEEAPGTRANYWLNTLLSENESQRDEWLEYTNARGIMTRPAWTPMHRLPMYSTCQRSQLANTDWLHQRIVNVPSSFPLNTKV